MPPDDGNTSTNEMEVAINRYNSLQNKINGVSNKLATINDTLSDPEKLVIFNECLVDLNDILVKTDGFYGGNPNNDWVTTLEGQQALYPQVSSAIDFVQGKIEELTSN